MSAKQLHNAHYQLGKAVIRYAFHPRCGETVIVTGRNRHGDEIALTIRQPDGTLAQLPVWMTKDLAEAMMVTENPRLSLACLRELRLELYACLSLLLDDSRRAGADKHDASATEPSPIRPFRAQGPANADGSLRADEVIATGERALDGDARRRRSDGGKR